MDADMNKSLAGQNQSQLTEKVTFVKLAGATFRMRRVFAEDGRMVKVYLGGEKL